MATNKKTQKSKGKNKKTNKKLLFGVLGGVVLVVVICLYVFLPSGNGSIITPKVKPLTNPVYIKTTVSYDELRTIDGIVYGLDYNYEHSEDGYQSYAEGGRLFKLDESNKRIAGEYIKSTTERCWALCSYKDATITELVIPNEIDGIPVLRVDENALYQYTNLKSVAFPENFEGIASWGFNGTNLSNVYIPTTVVFMESGCFENIETLESIHFPNKHYAQYYSSLCYNCPNLKEVTHS